MVGVPVYHYYVSIVCSFVYVLRKQSVCSYEGINNVVDIDFGVVIVEFI